MPCTVKPGSATFEAVSVNFSAERLKDPRSLGWECGFYPAVTEAKIVVPALKHLARNSGPVVVKYEDAVYLKHGFDPQFNAGQVFLELASKADPGAILKFSGHGDRSGGLVTPDMQITALSRLLGPVAGNHATVSGGSFNPSEFFPVPSGTHPAVIGENVKPDALFAALGGALLFGTIPLSVVLKVVGLDDASNLPRFITEGMSKLDGLIQDVATAQGLVSTVSKEIDSSVATSSVAAVKAKAATLKADAAAAAADLDALTTDLQRLIEDPKKLGDFETHLRSFVDDLQKLLGDLPPLDAIADDRRSLQQILSSFNEEVSAVKSIVDMLLAEQLTVKFVWNSVIQSIVMDLSKDPEKWFTAGDPNHPELALFVPNQPKTGFKISVEMQVAKTAAEPAMEIYCGLRDFKLQLLPSIETFVTLNFDVLEFTVSAGKSPDVNVKLKPGDSITFGGPLSFVNTLEKVIPFDGFSDPPSLSVTADGIKAGYSVGLPTVGIGIFSLQNMSLGAGFRVPFIADPLEVDFNFCSREQPFLLTVSLFGGGGYFAMSATPQGVNVEAALEFGAAIAINLVIYASLRLGQRSAHAADRLGQYALCRARRRR